MESSVPFIVGLIGGGSAETVSLLEGERRIHASENPSPVARISRSKREVEAHRNDVANVGAVDLVLEQENNERNRRKQQEASLTTDIYNQT